MTARILLKDKILLLLVYLQVLLLPGSVEWGREGRGMEAIVYLISIIGHIPRDL